MEDYSLSAVIKVDKEKCVNCHLCISVCPAKYCNNASKYEEGIQLDSNLCIGCGNCIKACTHNARIIIDDTEQFIEDLNNGQKISTIVAPAVDVNFPNELPNLLGWLKEMGTEMNFDVSFGAEITTYQYNKAFENGAQLPIIAQPCPCVVNYIEIYKPNLLKYLSPVGSPALNTASWIKSKYPNTKLAFISPCIAKKREFEDRNTDNKVQYNVTIYGLKKYFAQNGINLKNYQPVNFDDPIEAERGLLYSQPGGLYEAFKRYNSNLKRHQVRKTEGVEIYEEFFNELEKDIEKGDSEVILVDILNCIHGCNRGTGTIYDERSTDEVLKLQQKRLEKHEKIYQEKNKTIADLEEILSDMEEIDFTRQYNNKSQVFNRLETPTDDIVDIINQQMGKLKPDDIKNCGACGYNSCSKMAKAVLNGLYRAEQCHHFLENFYNLTIEEKTKIGVD